jgi:hypothetical protein
MSVSGEAIGAMLVGFLWGCIVGKWARIYWCRRGYDCDQKWKELF